MAKVLGVGTDELFNMMKKGQLRPDQLYKLADAMGAMADNSESFNKSLNNSLSAQIRFNNAMKELSRVVMESGLDKALATMFEYAVKGIKYFLQNVIPFFKELFRGLKTLWIMFKQVFDAIVNHPFITITLIAVVGWLLAWQAGLLGVLVAAGRFFTILTPIAKWIAAINVGMLRWIFLSTTLILLMAQLDGYLAGETNWLSVWNAYVQLLIANIELFFTYVKGGFITAGYYLDVWIANWLRGLNEISFGLLGISEQQKAIFDAEANMFGKNPELLNPGQQQKAIFASMLSSMGIGGGGTSTSTTVAPVVNVKFDMGNMSPQMKEAIQNGDMNAFGTSVGQSISLGGLNMFVGK